MKLLNFRARGQDHFGLAIDGHAVSFEDLQRRCGKEYADLKGINAYLQNLPRSFDHASELKAAAEGFAASGGTEGWSRLEEVKILPPIAEPAALLDFGLSPRHLFNSSKTMLKHEFGPLVSHLAAPILKRRFLKMSGSQTPPYYKGNHLAIIGDRDEMGWPPYTSYPDIEPELAVLTGNAGCKIAGYMIFNDASARDIQFPEMIGMGPARAKDFLKGNGLGPFLVTPDEVPEPQSLDVTVKVGTRFVWHGSTSEYTMHPARLVDCFEEVFSLIPGVVLGMGTIPGCAGLDNDQWIEPGDLIEITFDRLGTLHQRVPARPGTREPSRWKRRF